MTSSQLWTRPLNGLYLRTHQTPARYGDFITLASVFLQNIKKTDTVLEVGCGNSSLATQIWDQVGCKKLIGIDNRQVLHLCTELTIFSEVAIEQARKSASSGRDGLQFELADVFKLGSELERLDVGTKTFNCIVDKGTLDAIDNRAESEEQVYRYFDQLDSVLGLFGRYIVITLAQEHITKHIANYFLKK